MRDRQTERGREGDREERGGEGDVCVCVCVLDSLMKFSAKMMILCRV